MQPPTGALAGRVGSRACVRVGAVAYGAAVCLPGLAGSPPAFAAAAAAMGLGAGALDVSMNIAGAEVQERSPHRVFSSFHAAFSFGGMTGAAAGGLVAEAGVSPEAHLLVAGVLAAAVVLVAARRLPPAAVAAPGPAFARPTRGLVVLGAIAFCALLAEGSVGDWSAVHLTRELDATPAAAAAGLTAFSLCMALGRLAADPLSVRLGSMLVVRCGGALAAAGLVVALVASSTPLAVAGFALMGVGLAGAFPLALLAAAGSAGPSPGTAIAAVSTMGYAGLLAGPALIGLAAEATSLPTALAGVVVLCGAVALLAGALDSRFPCPPPPTPPR